MKTILKIASIIVLFLFVSGTLSAQKKCKVLKKEIAGHYTGKCRKGLANGNGKAVGTDTYTGHFKKGFPDGKGTYVWKNGNKYIGQWKQGLRWGEGTMYIHSEGTDTTLAGLWKEDRYTGPKPIKPKIIASVGVDRYSFQKSGENRNRVLIDIYQNGAPNLEINDFIMNSTSGSETNLGRSIGYEFLEFPVEMKIIYYTWNKLHTAQIYVKFQFVISEPGDWRVTITN